MSQSLANEKRFNRYSANGVTSTIGINRFQIVETLGSGQNLLKQPRRRSVILVLQLPALWQFQSCHLLNQNTRKKVQPYR